MIDSFGMEGYGMWWRLLEIVALQMDESDRCHVTFSSQNWAKVFGVSQRKSDKFLSFLENISLVVLEKNPYSDPNKTTVSIPNLLKFRDEYTKKKKEKV